MRTSDHLYGQRELQVDSEVCALGKFDPAALEHVVAGAQLEHRRLKGNRELFGETPSETLRSRRNYMINPILNAC